MRRRNPFAPEPPRIPLPDHEPVPASPDYEDQRAGGLQIGYITSLREYERARKVTKKIPFGFRAPEDTVA